MSADSHTVCPRCHPEVIGWSSTKHDSGVTDHAAEELGLTRSLRENYQFWVQDGNTLVSEYYADCWDCGFHFEINHQDPIPGVT